MNLEEDWPRQPIHLEVDQNASSKELNKSSVKINRLNFAADFENILLNRTSSWKRLVRVVAWMKRCRTGSKHKHLSAQELEQAKLSLFWIAQSHFRDSTQAKVGQKLNLKSFSNDPLELLRIHGRLNNFFDNKDIANPIALPSKSKITRLFAEFIHRSYGHQGYRVILVNLREKGIYIVRGKLLLKSVASNCIQCRIYRRNLLRQQMGHLPAFRFKNYCAPFSSVALDFFGPIKIKKTRNVVINGSCLVIVCNTTRVIHLELTETQSTDDFLLALKRFVTKRGVHPSHAYSDRAQTFVSSQKLILAEQLGQIKSLQHQSIARHYGNLMFRLLAI